MRPKLYTCDDNFFEIDNEKSFYWAGFLAADGCLFNKHIILCLAEKDKDHLILFKII